MIMTDINKLPHFVELEEQKYFLSLNRDSEGHWVIGYMEYENHSLPDGLAINASDTIDEAATRLDYALTRFNKRYVV